MAQLSDTQCILLSAASQRESGSVLPLPAGVTRGGGTSKAITALLKRALIEERQAHEAAAIYRTDGDIDYGVYISDAGLTAIGIAPTDGPSGATASPYTEAPAPTSDPPTATKQSKATTVLALLTRPQGATLAELIEITGWLPHTTRAALTGLRKKGHEIERCKRDGTTCYRIGRAA